MFDALLAGGFQYSAPEDATAVDHEGVTLGQRKNQLSRRLRMVRKHSPGSNQDGGSDSHSASEGGIGGNTTGSGAALSTNSQQDRRQRLMQQGSSGGDSRRNSAGSNKLAARALQMKQEQAGIGELSDEDMDTVEQDQQQLNKKPRMARYHPDFAPIFIPPQSSVLAGMAAPKLSVCTPVPPPNTQAAMMDGSVGMTPSMMAAHGAFFSHQQLVNPFSHNRPSSVAISSLNHSAQAVGLTLEQLAINLAADSTTIAKILAENSTSDAATKKMKLALRLFEMDVKTLYSTSMLRAGYDPRDCQINSPPYQEFAQNAWEREAARLKSSGMTWDLSLPDLDKQDPGLSEDLEDEHSHSQGQSTNGGDKKRAAGDHEHRHMHRMDGQCGHKAIIHKPKDGQPHIDFVVGDHVECYHGIEPFGKSADTAWPSLYKGRDAGGDSCGPELYKDLSDDIQTPKIIELSSINLHDPEWNYDLTGSIDSGIAGLFRLSEKLDVTNV